MRRLRIIWRWFGRKFGFSRLVCLVLLVGIGALRIADLGPVEELRVRTFDFYQRFDPRVKTARPITIIDIDDPSLKKLGQWPWPRAGGAGGGGGRAGRGAGAGAGDGGGAEPD